MVAPKRSVPTPSLFARSMQLLGLSEVYSMYSTLAQAQEMQTKSDAVLKDAQNIKASEVQARVNADEAHLVVDTSQQQLKNLLANKGIIVNHVEVIKNPEEWINAVHVLSQNIEDANDLITALEDTRSHKKQAVEKKHSRKDLQNTIQAFFKPDDPTTAITVNFKSDSIESISIVKSDSNVLLHLHPQGKTLIFDKSELSKVAEVYSNLTQALPAEFITQYAYPKVAEKPQQRAESVKPKDSRADAVGQKHKDIDRSIPKHGVKEEQTVTPQTPSTKPQNK